MPQNCGLLALEQIAALKNISAFTLVHLGRDNGLNLFVFKVNDLADLPRVQRPAIFHQDDHFVYVENGKIMPEGKYTGYVIGTAVLGRVIGLSEAKFITGGKNFFTGENKDGVKEGQGALGAVLGVVGGVVGTIIGGPGLGAAIGGAIGGAGGSAITGDNPITGALTGGLEGFGVGSIASGLSSAGAGAAATGTSASSNLASQGVFNAARAATVIDPASATLSSAGSGLGAFNAATGASSLANSSLGFSNTAPLNAANNANAASAAINNATGSANATAPANAANSAFATGNSVLSPSSLNTASGASSAATGGNGLLNSIGGTIGKAVTANPLGSIASATGALGLFGSQAPAYSGATPTANYNAVSTFLGSTPQGAANNAAGLAATNSNTDTVNTSIPDLQKQFTGNNQRTLDTINTAYDNQKQLLVHQYAQAGQNLANSSELQDKVTQLEQKRTNDLTLAQQELQDQALGQAISVKQQALSSSMQAGQYNSTLAMQLAGLSGDQENLQYAIANNDYTSFQQIMGKLLTMGIPQKVSLTA